MLYPFKSILSKLLVLSQKQIPQDCPKCGGKVKLKTVNKPGPNQGRQFYGCSSKVNGQWCNTWIGWVDEFEGYEAPNQEIEETPSEVSKPNNFMGKVMPNPWVAATFNADHRTVALNKNNDGTWLWQDENGNHGEVTADEVKTLFTSIKDPRSGKILMSRDLAQLFDLMKRALEKHSLDEHMWTLYLAKNLYAASAGDPIAVKGAFWIDEEGNRGKLTSLEEDVEPYQDGEIKSYKAEDVFKVYREQNPKNKDFKPSKYQQNVLDRFSSTDENIMINALAGSGKTTSLKQISNLMKPGEKWLYLVFNKRNQVEASQPGEFPKGVTTLTSHSFLGSLLNTASDNNMMPATDIWNKDKSQKLYEISEQVVEQDGVIRKPYSFPAQRVVSNIVSKAKNNGVDPNDANIADQLKSIAQEYEISLDLSTERRDCPQDFSEHIIKLSVDAMKASLIGAVEDPALNSTRDHDDTLWYAKIYSENIQWPKYDVVMADEVQDFNKCQTFMLSKLKEQGARIIAVGDPNQSLYMFRGADENAFQEVHNVTGASEQLPLPANYRSGTAIVDFINRNTIVNNLEAGRTHKGIVTQDTPPEEAFDGIANEWQRNGRKLDKQTTFISYSNAPLVKGAMDLISKDIDFELMGKDLSKDLVGQINSILGKGMYHKTKPIEDMASVLSDHLQKLERRWGGKITKQDELAELRQNIEALQSILIHLSSHDYEDKRLGVKVRNSKDLMQYLIKKFQGVDETSPRDVSNLKRKDPRSYVLLTTSHKSKGFEYNRAYILEPGTFESNQKDTRMSSQQKENAWYVALSRAEKELHILASSDKDDD